MPFVTHEWPAMPWLGSQTPTLGLPDGLFSNQKSQFGKNFQVLRLENIDIFYGHLEYFMDIWDIV
jgi:hypothetical protein